MSCDLKIAIGSVVPHVFAGFSGGPKIILPGICSFETCRDFHRLGSQYALKNRSRAFGLGIIEDNPLRLNMDEAARLVGLDFKIDTLMNSFGETVAVYAGSLSQAYPLAVQDAQVNYDTDQVLDQDVAIANTYAKVAECEGGLEIASPSIKKEGGELILISHAPEGYVTHYLMGQFGNRNQGSFQMRCALSPYIKRLIIYNKYLDLTILDHFAQPERVVLTADWNEVLALIDRAHPGPVKVAVYPDADIQYSSRNSGSKILSF
jgi:nickel-dependent lactate racemase